MKQLLPHGEHQLSFPVFWLRPEKKICFEIKKKKKGKQKKRKKEEKKKIKFFSASF